MRVVTNINNLTKKRINPDFVKKVVRDTVKLAGVSLKLFEVSIVFVGKAEIQKINHRYRKRNKSTDVLSFNLSSGYNKNGKTLEGELVICPQVIEKNARQHEVDFLRELAFVLSHGVLHILGWKHSKKMYELQDKVVLLSTN